MGPTLLCAMFCWRLERQLMLKGHFRPPPSSPPPVRAMRMYAGAKGSMGGRHMGSRCQNYCCQYLHDLCGTIYIFILGPTSHFFLISQHPTISQLHFLGTEPNKEQEPLPPSTCGTCECAFGGQACTQRFALRCRTRDQRPFENESFIFPAKKSSMVG